VQNVQQEVMTRLFIKQASKRKSEHRLASFATTAVGLHLNLLHFHDRYADEQRLQIAHQHRSGPAPALLRLDHHRRSARIDLPKAEYLGKIVLTNQPAQRV
jgi:hypothetical protein